MILTTDSEQIFEFLSDIHRLPRDFSSSELLPIEHDHNFHIVVYKASPEQRSFTMYSVADFQNNPSALQQLFTHLQDTDDETLHPSLKEKALREVESRIHARPGDSLFFDAH